MAARAEARDEVGEVSEALRAEIEAAMQGKTADFHHWYERNNFGDAGAVFLAERLRGNKDVEELSLQNCTIGAVGVRALANVLAEDNTTLGHLSLFNNPSLGDDGAQAMAQMLRKNSTLEFLSLGACGVGDRGVRALGEALKENITLKRLSLNSSRLTDVGASSVLAALRESNSTLTYLYLDGNSYINDSIKDPIQELIDENEAVVPETAERRARCLLFCCLQLAPTAQEHVVPSIGAVPVPVLQYAVEHAGGLHVAKRFEHGNVVAGNSSARTRARSSSSSDSLDDILESATSRRP